jgi:hypothetical protein
MLGVALALPVVAEARPVTYPGGSMSMTEVVGSSVITQVDHTLNRHVAVGAYALTEAGGDRLSTGLVANFLVMRRNTENSQANAYVLTGLGPSWTRLPSGGREAQTSGWIAGEADWETRRLFFGGMAKASVVGDDVETGYRLRAGVAPYVANTGHLHTWLFLQVGRQAMPGAETEVTPLVRLFKGPVLAEAGVSHRGRAFGTLWFYF